MDIYNTIKLTLDEALRRTQADPKKFRPWLQGFRDYAFNRRAFGPVEVATQIRATTDADASGWSLWNPRNRYDSSGLAEPVVRKPTPGADKPSASAPRRGKAR